MKRRPGSGTWPASRWPELFEASLDLFATLPAGSSWSLGGGTRLAVLYGHRTSYDVDIFVTDAQLVPFISPRLNDRAVALFGDDYVEDSASLKLKTAMGDLDVIVAPVLTQPGVEPAEVLGHRVLAQTAEEILAKKMRYRGHAFTHRDAFDLAMLLDRDPARVALAVDASGPAVMALMAQRLDLFLPVLTAELPEFVNPTDSGRPLLATAADQIAAWLAAVRAAGRA